MKKTINFYDFCDEFNHFEDRKNSFSYKGKKALFEYLEEYEESTGEQIELDIVALDCEYTEWSNATEAACEYFEFEGMKFDEEGNEEETADEVEQKALDFLEYHTQVIKVEGGGVIIQNF